MEQIINRIKKLMALTQERGATEAEAAIAAEHVQRLLAEHNLSFAAIERAGGIASPGGQRAKEKAAYRQVYKWQRNLMKALGKVNYTHVEMRYTTNPNPYKTDMVFDGYELIGRVDNVATVRMMFEYSIEAAERLARAAVDNDPTRYFTREAHSFKEGCADRSMERLEEQHERILREQEREAREANARARHPGSTGNALVVVLRDVVQDELDLNEDYRLGKPPGTTAREREESKARYEQVKRERAIKQAALEAQGIPKNVAEWMVLGYSEEKARELAGDGPKRIETAAQAAKRRAKEERENERWQRQHWNQQRKEHRRLDRGAYDAGRQAGDEVSLNRQIDRKDHTKLRGG